MFVLILSIDINEFPTFGLTSNIKQYICIRKTRRFINDYYVYQNTRFKTKLIDFEKSKEKGFLDQDSQY